MPSKSKKIKKPKCHHRSVLDNGIVVITEKAKHFQTLAIGVWVKSGSREESESNAGMAHFLEHMMFKGTSRQYGGDDLTHCITGAPVVQFKTEKSVK